MLIIMFMVVSIMMMMQGLSGIGVARLMAM